MSVGKSQAGALGAGGASLERVRAMALTATQPMLGGAGAGFQGARGGHALVDASYVAASLAARHSSTHRWSCSSFWGQGGSSSSTGLLVGVSGRHTGAPSRLRAAGAAGALPLPWAPSAEGPREGPRLLHALLRPEGQSRDSEPQEEGARDEEAEVSREEGGDRGDGKSGPWPQLTPTIMGSTGPRSEAPASTGELRQRSTERGPEGLLAQPLPACLEPRGWQEEWGPVMPPLCGTGWALRPGGVGCWGERRGRGGRPDMGQKAAHTEDRRCRSERCRKGDD
jgi:hypothetical protein